VYPGRYAQQNPDRPCFIMANTGETVTYAQYEARCNQLAHLLRAHGLQPLDHYSIFMENNSRYLETCGAGERAGLHYTCINSHLTVDELAYIVDNSESKALITSRAKRDVAMEAVKKCPKVTLFLIVDGTGDDGPFADYVTAVSEHPTTPIPDERLGTPMLYSSGTTGQPKGIIRPLPDQPPGEPLPLFTFLLDLWRYREDMVYLSPAPLYHSAPQAACNLTIRIGGTIVVMEQFDPEQYLALVETYRVTHSQLVPTMFSRMLKLPEEVRTKYDLSSLETVVHAAAPCPIPVKEQMIEWWGPIVLEYYGATEAIGFTACDSEEWLAHRGTVGKVILGDLHILDEEMNPCPVGTPGTIWFKVPAPLEYFNAPEKSRESMSPDGTMSTVGDVGYVDDDGYLYLTDRKTFMIISGGVNIYPQEAENLLITHPRVADAAVFGVPNPDLGEEVKAVVQPMPGVEPGPALERELIAFCQEHLARQKCPRSIDFDAELPRLPTGKLYKRVLRDRYWGDATTRIAQ
jgi:long-chain acyl-CoA synthetase